MLVIPALRLVTLLLLLAVLIDGATGQDLYNNWDFVVWDEKPDLPAGLFDLLRVALSISLAWDAWTHTRYASLGFLGSMGWTVVLTLLLILYQPVFPVQFAYHWWLWIDLVSFGVLAVHTLAVSKPLFELMSGMVSRGENVLAASQQEVIAAIFLGYANAASLMARSTEYLTEKQGPTTNGAEQETRPENKPFDVDHLGLAARTSSPQLSLDHHRGDVEQVAMKWMDEEGWTKILTDEEKREIIAVLRRSGGDPRIVLDRVIKRKVDGAESARPQIESASLSHGLGDLEPDETQHSNKGAVEKAIVEVGALKVKRTQIVEALERTTKMKRAPAGARSSKLKEGAFVPELVGFRVEMPGGSSLVVLEEGRLDREVVFFASKMEPIRKVLSSYHGDDDIVQISIGETVMVFRCGSSKLTVPIVAKGPQ